MMGRGPDRVHSKFKPPDLNGHAPADDFSKSQHRYFHTNQALYLLSDALDHLGKLVHHAQGEPVHREFTRARQKALEAMTRLSKIESDLAEQADSKGGEA